MKSEEKKTYDKPKITQIKLDAACAVLGFCKTGGKIGPGAPGCSSGSACDSPGS